MIIIKTKDFYHIEQFPAYNVLVKTSMKHLLLFTVAACEDVEIGQVGVRAVFLHGDLEGEIS